MSRLIAKAGTAIVKPYQKYSDREAQIWIPQIAKYVSGRTGQVLDYSPYPEHSNFMVYDSHGNRVSKEAWRNNHSFIGLIDKHILFKTGIRVQWQGSDYIIVRLEHILAMSDDKFGDSDNNDIGLVARCQFCKSTGEGNIMLDASGYCPRCKLNVKGMVKSNEVTVSDDEVYKLTGKDAKARIKQRKGIADKEQIISYSGQRNRSKTKIA